MKAVWFYCRGGLRDTASIGSGLPGEPERAGLRENWTHYPDDHAGIRQRISKKPSDRELAPLKIRSDGSVRKGVELDQ